MERLFKDRKEAGQLLARKLHVLIKDERNNLVILALPRGGVPIAAELSRLEKLPFEVLIIRKIGHPHNREYGIGAVAEDGSYWLNGLYLDVSTHINAQIDAILNEEKSEIERRKKLYRHNKPLPSLKDKTVILLDDGLATGVTAKLAAQFVKNQGAKKVILAVPVCAVESARELRRKGIDVVCFDEFQKFLSVSQYYENFEQVDDIEVINILDETRMLFSDRQKELE